MGLLDPLFAQVLSGFGVQQEDPQGAMLSEFLRLPQQPAQAPAQPALPTGHMMPQTQQAAPQPRPMAPPEPNLLDRIGAMARGYGTGGIIGGVTDAINLGNSQAERAQAQQRNQTLDYLTANKIDPQTAQLAITNPELMKSLLGSVVSKRYGDKGEEFREMKGRGYGLGRGPDGKLALRLLDGQAPAGATMLPGTIEGAPYEDPEKVVNLIKGLRGDFEGGQAFKTHAVTTDAYRKMENALATESAAGDVSGIYAFMKMIDPGAVVREQDFATASNAAGVPDQIRNLYNRIKSGERLAPEQRADFIRQGRELYAGTKKLFEKHKNNYKGIARRLYLDDANIVTDIEDEPAAAPAAPPAPEQVQRLDMGAVKGRSGPLVAPPVRISSDAEFDKLPSGTPFMGPDGIARRKP
jgi:hypothetical protein